MDRFENARDATLAKYRMMQRPKGKLADAVSLAVDAVAILCLGKHTCSRVIPQLSASTNVYGRWLRDVNFLSL